MEFCVNTNEAKMMSNNVNRVYNNISNSSINSYIKTKRLDVFVTLANTKDTSSKVLKLTEKEMEMIMYNRSMQMSFISPNKENMNHNTLHPPQSYDLSVLSQCCSDSDKDDEEICSSQNEM